MVLPDNELSLSEKESLEKVLKPFIITDELLEKFLEIFSDDLKKGLKKSSNHAADMKTFPTYVSTLPTGKERGRYLVSFKWGERPLLVLHCETSDGAI